MKERVRETGELNVQLKSYLSKIHLKRMEESIKASFTIFLKVSYPFTSMECYMPEMNSAEKHCES